MKISANEVVCANPDDPVDNEMYLFLYGQGIYQSEVYKSHRRDCLEFYADRNSHDISKARQIFRIEWDF